MNVPDCDWLLPNQSEPIDRRGPHVYGGKEQPVESLVNRGPLTVGRPIDCNRTIWRANDYERVRCA